MINQLIVSLIIAIYLLVPGYFLLVIARVQHNRFLLAYGLSISIHILTLTFYLWLPTTSVWWIAILDVGVLMIVSGLVWYYKNKFLPYRPSTIFLIGKNGQVIFCWVVLMFTYTFYHVLVGPYTEIPSDFWKHLARVNMTQDLLSSPDIQNTNLVDYLSSGSSLIYILQSLLTRVLVLDPIDVVPAVTLISSSIFLSSIFWFSISIFHRFFGTNHWILIGACLATLLTLVSFGTATFSYARYYAYFPTIFAFPLVYASIAIFLAFLENPNSQRLQLLLIPLFVIVMALIHRQEAMLTIIILGTIAVVRSVRSFSPSSDLPGVLAKRARTSASYFIIFFFIIAIYAFTTRQLTGWQNTPHVIDSGFYLSFLKGLPIDNPQFRLWDTLGIFGLLIYLWCIPYWKTIGRSDYLIAGMLVPILTNLNPLYTTVFLHYGSPTTLWRTAYLIPLPMVAALLICFSISTKNSSVRTWKCVSNYFIIVCLIISLAPWSVQGYYNRTTRIPSLIPTHSHSGAGLWMDLIEAVRIIENKSTVKRIWTDQITKFVVYTATRGQIFPWSDQEYFPKNSHTYREDFMQSDLTDTLLVVNKRNGVSTASAKHARHWPETILHVSRHYPKDLDNFISTHKDHFKFIWESTDIAIYQMNSFNH